MEPLNKTTAFRYIDGKFYINSEPIIVKNIVAEAKITVDLLNGSTVIISCSSKESEIMVKGKLDYHLMR
jgi:hypothetical protein